MKKRRLLEYRPYSKQFLFHKEGATHRERLLMALNQGGKTLAGGMETAMHSTGYYPDWWEGRKFPGQIRCWVSGISNEQTRDNVQRMLLGPPEALGTGTIPFDRIKDITWARGIPNFADIVFVQHVDGGTSSINFKSYEMGRKKWQGETLDFLWFDEEPPLELYTEGLARITATRGFTFITFTPLLGMTEVVEQFYPAPNHTSRSMVRMEIEDIAAEPHGHITKDQVEEIVSSYPPYEREARTKGIPVLGSGRVYPILEELISCQPFEIPLHWARICGMDFGYDHPTAVVWLAWNRDTDCVYLYDCYSQREETPAVHVAAIKARGEEIPVAWPWDGHKHDPGSGIPLARHYVEAGLKMLPEHAKLARVEKKRREAGVAMVYDRMKTGRFKIFSSCTSVWEEFRGYHRKDGMIVDRKDDLMDAMRYAVMCLKFARAPIEYRREFPKTTGMDYDPISGGTVAEAL